MKKRVHLYVRQKHPCVWLMAVCMLASAVGRFFLTPGGDLLLPGLAALLYAGITVFSGDEMFYKTAIPVWIMGICSILRLLRLESQLIPLMLACGCTVFFCVVYTAVVSGQAVRHCLLPLYPAALALMWYVTIVYRKDPMLLLPDVIMVVGMIALIPAIDVHTDGKFHPSWGDRIEGRRVRTAPPMEQIVPYFMPHRTGANNLFAESVEITPVESYIREKRRQGLTGFGVTHVLLSAYVRTVAKYPALNRFIAGQRIYSRGEDIVLCMTVKKEMTTSAPDSLIKVHLHPNATAEDVYHAFNRQVAAAKDEMEDTDADNTVGAFALIPGLVMKSIFGLLRMMDYFGLLPRFLLEISPFHGSAYFTAVGSLGIRPVYHHLYDFGTVPVFCAFGKKRKAQEVCDGEIVTRKYVDLTFNLDERICDGFYYANVIKHFLRIMAHPEVLDQPPETVHRDID